MKTTKSAQADRAFAIEALRELLPPGTTVQCVLRQVARSGMSRNIDFYVIVDGDLRYLSAYFSRIYPGTLTDNGFRVSGCGMDMGFVVVYHVARVLYPEGFPCCGRGQYPDTCPSNEHGNGDQNYAPHAHSDGGYALRCNWI